MPLNPGLRQIQEGSQDTASTGEGRTFSIYDAVDIFLDNRWIIGGVTVLAACLGFLYAYFGEPIYEANTLIQVEDVKSNPFANLQADNILEVKSAAQTEIEILRSRLVLGKAVDKLQLDQLVIPKYLPVVGSWLPRILAKTPFSDLPSWRGYILSPARINLGHLRVPEPLRNVPFTVILSGSGYKLQGPLGEILGNGELGKPLKFALYDQSGELLIANASGAAGSEFLVMLLPKLPMIQNLQYGIRINEVGRQTGMIRSSHEGRDPREIVRVLNEIAQIYVTQNIERKAAEAEKSLQFLSRQLPELREELEKSERVYNQFRSAQGFFDLGGEASAILSRSSQLRVLLIENKRKKAELDKRYTDQHPVLQALESERIAVQRELDELERTARQLPGREQDMLRLMRDVKVNNELYTNLLNNAQQLRLVKEGKVGNVRLIDQAVEPLTPIKPRMSQIVTLSIIIGLVLGVGLALFRYFMRPVIRTGDDIERTLGLSVLSTVPFSPNQTSLEKGRDPDQLGLLCLLEPDDPAVEGLRSLRSSIQFILNSDSPQNRLIMVTGPSPGIGKSFVSANLAALLAAAGKRVLLIDGDLRMGHLHPYMNQKRERGFSELIAGSLSVQEVIHTNVVQGLDFMSTGTLPHNPGELLLSQQCGDLLSKLGGEYDHVILDSAPLLLVSDSLALAQVVGKILIVARADVSTIGELAESLRRIRLNGASSVPGVVFNGLDIFRNRYSQNYEFDYYRYRYRYKNYGTAYARSKRALK